MRIVGLDSDDSQLLERIEALARDSREPVEVRPIGSRRLRGTLVSYAEIVDCRGSGKRDLEEKPEWPVILYGSVATGADVVPGSVIELPAETPPETVFAVAVAAASWRGVRREVELRRREHDLLRALHGFFAGSDLEDVFGLVIEHLLENLGLSFGYLLLEEPDRKQIVRRFQGEPRHRDGSVYVPLIGDAEFHELATGDEGHQLIDREWKDPSGERHSATFLLIPMRGHQRVIGFAKLPLSRAERARLDQEGLDRVTSLLSVVAPGIENLLSLAEIRELTIRDDLTRAYNRRYFERIIDEEIERARRYAGLFSLIFLDLDDLKSVNDDHGHLIGSRVLQEVGKRMITAVRGIDKVVRFGGDEFCVILPQTDEQRAAGVAERIRESISEEGYQLGPGIAVRVTASFGIATYPTHATTKDELIRAADRAMYCVKTRSKNSIRVAEQPESEPGDDRPTVLERTGLTDGGEAG